MLEIRCDPAFVEETVFLTVSDRRSSFQRQREAAYELVDPRQREVAFQRLANRHFQTLGWSQWFAERFSEWPSISSELELAVIRRVWQRKDEQVELYVDRPGDARSTVALSKTLWIGLQPVRCLDREHLTAWLRHELMHIDDMLEPAFAYDPHPVFGADWEPEHELIRARFRALWDLWVHRRMRRRGWQTILDDASRRAEVARAFASMSGAERDALMAVVDHQERWTQGELLALARQALVEVMG